MVGLCRPRQADGGKSRHEIITKQDTNAMLRIFVFVLRGGLDGKSICLQFRRPGFDPWVGRIPWRRKGYPLLKGKQTVTNKQNKRVSTKCLNPTFPVCVHVCVFSCVRYFVTP